MKFGFSVGEFFVADSRAHRCHWRMWAVLKKNMVQVYPSSHNHGGENWVPPIVFTFQTH